jgi:L-seryl-tRNA(Ser) seleniumtransferase
MPSHPRLIPSIDKLRQRPSVRRLERRYGRETTTQALRDEAAALRRHLADDTLTVRDAAEAAERIETGLASRLAAALSPSLRPVINATGVIVHTNLGRAPLGRAAIDRIAALAGGYTNLEYDLPAGQRGSRDVHASTLAARLTGAEAAVVVNNNAAAVLLTLAALAAGREVIISRGELVEIGGGFRVPDVLKQSGAILREVGTTNRTRADDYAAAIDDRTAILLRVHPSNFRIEGFTERPSLAEVAELGARFRIPVVEDLGSGCLKPIEGIEDEPTVGASIAAGVAVCTFSGDKLLGGPQAGVIAGRRAELDRIRTHPLMRAMRVDKLTYAALEATLIEHATGRAGEAVPVVRMIEEPVARLEARAETLRSRLSQVTGLSISVAATEATIGGGSTPGITLPSRALVVEVPDGSAAALAARLRAGSPPVVGRIADDRLLLDLRTVNAGEDDLLAAVVTNLAPARRRD